jgi:hypothetical protein
VEDVLMAVVEEDAELHAAPKKKPETIPGFH